MTTPQPITISEIFQNPRQAFSRFSAINRLLAVVAVAHFGLLLLFIGGLVVDSRVVTGSPVWLKPAKFAFSIGLYSMTVLWMLSFISGRRRLVNFVASVIGLGFITEMLGIAGQATRGQSIIAPDGLTLAGFGGVALVSLAVLIAAWLVGSNKPRNRSVLPAPAD